MASRISRLTTAFVADTFREAFARLVFWGFYGLSTVLILFFLFILKIDIVEGARATISLFGQAGPRAMEIDKLVRGAHSVVATFLYTWGMAIAVFASAGLVPTVLEPGRIELLLSKPVARHHILLGRFLGNLLVVALNLAYLVTGVWLVFGWKTGVWRADFLWAIATATFIFAILLSVIFLASVLFESAALSVMVAFGLMVMSPILAQTKLMERLLSSQWSRSLWKSLYHALPKVFDLGDMTLKLVQGQAVQSWLPVWTSAAFASVMIALSLVFFARRNY